MYLSLMGAVNQLTASENHLVGMKMIPTSQRSTGCCVSYKVGPYETSFMEGRNEALRSLELALDQGKTYHDPFGTFGDVASGQPHGGWESSVPAKTLCYLFV